MSDLVFCPPNVDCPCYARLVDEAKRLREANELMLTDIRRTDVDMLAFKARIEQLEAALRDLIWYTNQLELTVYDPSDWPTEHDEVRNARAALGEERT